MAFQPVRLRIDEHEVFLNLAGFGGAARLDSSNSRKSLLAVLPNPYWRWFFGGHPAQPQVLSSLPIQKLSKLFVSATAALSGNPD